MAYDILGHGNTPLTKSQISFDDFSLQLLNLIDELKFEKMHLVGFSIGSLIARNFASKYNNRLESLTLLCSVFQRSNEQQQIVNDRFELSKKSRSLSKQALKRWFTDDYLEKYPDTYQKITSILKSNNMQNGSISSWNQKVKKLLARTYICLLYTSQSKRDKRGSSLP